MNRPKINIVGTLRFSEDGGLLFSISLDDGKESHPDDVFEEFLMWYYNPSAPDGEHSQWLEALPNAYRYETFTNFPSKREFSRALHANENYKEAASLLMDQQRCDPALIFDFEGHRFPVTFWFYRDKVVRSESIEAEVPVNDIPLFIKHYILRIGRDYEKIRREVEALENLESLVGTSREPIPEPVRLYVWQRDKGQCVKCGSRERLEFDHIIPISAGGSSTERNVQILCETCNRSKGATI
jgi:hypothetical protein